MKKEETNLKGFKISTLLFILLVIFAVILFVMSLQANPNPEIMKTFGDIMKGLAGALIGAMAGERRR